MSSLDGVVRAGFGVGAALVAGVILSACSSPQNSANDAPATTTTTATAAGPATTVVATTAQSAKPVQPAANRPADACASATKAKLEAALKADKQFSGTLLVDSKGLQHIKCVAPWAFAHFSNTIDGGRVLFAYRNGSWVPQTGGTGELCEKVPAATAEKVCV